MTVPSNPLPFQNASSSNFVSIEQHAADLARVYSDISKQTALVQDSIALVNGNGRLIDQVMDIANRSLVLVQNTEDRLDRLAASQQRLWQSQVVLAAMWLVTVLFVVLV